MHAQAEAGRRMRRPPAAVPVARTQPVTKKQAAAGSVRGAMTAYDRPMICGLGRMDERDAVSRHLAAEAGSAQRTPSIRCAARKAPLCNLDPLTVMRKNLAAWRGGRKEGG